MRAWEGDFSMDLLAGKKTWKDLGEICKIMGNNYGKCGRFGKLPENAAKSGGNGKRGEILGRSIGENAKKS